MPSRKSRDFSHGMDSASLFGSGKLKELERANEKLQDEVSKRNTNIEKLQSQVQQMKELAATVDRRGVFTRALPHAAARQDARRLLQAQRVAHVGAARGERF